jgi:hypothetical protein
MLKIRCETRRQSVIGGGAVEHFEYCESNIENSDQRSESPKHKDRESETLVNSAKNRVIVVVPYSFLATDLVPKKPGYNTTPFSTRILELQKSRQGARVAR